MTTEIINNGIKDIVVLVADIANNKVLIRKGYPNELLGDRFALGISYYIDGAKLDTPHEDVIEDFTEIDAPEGYYDVIEPTPYVEPEISDAEALRIIMGG